MKQPGLILLLCASVWAQGVPPHTQHYPNIQNGLVMYGAMGYADSSAWPAINTWLGQRFDLVIGGDDPNVNRYAPSDWHYHGDPHGGNPTQVYWAAYTDMAHITPNSLYYVQSTASANSFAFENMFLHTSVDMAVPAGTQYNYSQTHGGLPWNTAEFDQFEPYRGGGENYIGGVFTYNGSSYADVTHQTFLGNVNTTISNTLYVGSMEPFDQMNFVISTPRAFGSVAYKYWNGSTWATLSTSGPNCDGTSGLTTSGMLYFYPPSDWTSRTLSVNVSSPAPIATTTSKFWVMLVVTGAATNPVYRTIKGDDWSVASSGNNHRGWNATDSHRINIGTRLEYNPTPPSNATARFRYQSRVTSYGSNDAYGNPADVQGGARTWGQYLVDQTNYQMSNSTQSLAYDGAFFDDAMQIPVATTPATSYQYYDINQTNGWIVEWQFCYQYIRNTLRTAYGNNFPVMVNGFMGAVGTPGLGITIGDSSVQADYGFEEGFWGGPTTFAPFPTYTYNAAGPAPYDWALPSHNPNGMRIWFQYTDPYAVNVPWKPGDGYHTVWHYVDHANRTPILSLAMHYLGANANTGFMYNGGVGGFNSYVQTDQVLTYLPSTTVVGSVSVDTSPSPKTITLANAAGCVAPFPVSPLPVLQLGANGDLLQGSFTGNVFTTTFPIYNAYPSGTQASCVVSQHLSQISGPLVSTVNAWTRWFPAMGVDIGAPNPSGMNAGARMVETPWLAGASVSGQSNPTVTCAAGGCPDVWRRDFTNAIVVMRPWKNTMIESELDTFSIPISLGGTYYPLSADGTMGPGITSVVLRGAEAMILMKPAQSRPSCDLNGDAQVDVRDIALIVLQALGITSCTNGDLNLDGACNMQDVQIAVNAVLGGQCQSGR